MPESVFCHACMVTTTSEAQYSNAGDRVCPACESDFVEITEVPAQPSVSVDFNVYSSESLSSVIPWVIVWGYISLSDC